MPMGIQLTPEEAWEFLERGHTGILTSLRRDGRPVSLPVWYVAHQGGIYVRGPAHTRKFGRLRRDGRVSFLVESGLKWVELKAVHVSGRARFVEDAAEAERIDAELDRKYAAFRPARSSMPQATQRHYGRGSALIRIDPEEWISWDNAKIRMRT
jgi:nitroimidazol reductase NimA-like FMN-containing flavoprotein (pyridoxamine 5'-phosphate oxidase superfamily)